MNYNRDNRNSKRQQGQNQTIQQEWQAFLEKLKKDKNPLYELLQGSGIDEDGDALKLYIPTEDKKKEAQGKIPKIQAKLPNHWQKKRINLVVGEPPVELLQPSKKQPVSQSKPGSNSSSVMGRHKVLQSPLQELNFAEFGVDKKLNELAQPVLEAAAAADETCEILYKQLTEKTQKLADVTITVAFPWRVRVGGMRGFRELLLPVFHPVYGVPYIPSSSLKGAIRAIALQHETQSEVNRLLGSLDDGIGCVQILDAFPTAACLSVDMANPQWHWHKNNVEYNPQPHALLSMEQPELVIGLIRTSRGNNADDVEKVKGWLEKALAMGIGSRLSAGYGRASLSHTLPHSSSHDFHLWTQGMYGASTDNPEFRPVALRGMLRYWFRAIALGIYSPSQCKELEATLFGTLEPKTKEGSIRIAVEWEEAPSDGPAGTRPKGERAYFYKGKILLEAKNQQHLTLIEKLLRLSSHLAGVGRGSRRPLHWNSGRMRGCHWELTNAILPSDKQSWQDFLKQVREAFLAVQRPQGSPSSSSPDNSRCQDVLNNKAEIYLVPCLGMKHPKNVVTVHRI
ncbi:RAMP superfamily CRISPR-associated protein [Mastigocladopsis repens]|uniref:RAMP superfamily CRISPR-associated protein n=1 Tax=Mastigocladopsis repens TaxID=221287 RepID=UPI00031E7AD1|nr:RAMP superfamily CRISPR-associated protein [Mastigocladopsis repens]